MKASKRYREIVERNFDKASKVGCKFRNKDLRRLKSATPASTLNDLFDLNYSISATLENGKPSFTNPIAEVIPKANRLFSVIDSLGLSNNNSVANLYHQPVILGLEHGIIAIPNSDDSSD